MYISIKYLYGVVSRNDKIGKLKQVEVRQGAGGRKEEAEEEDGAARRQRNPNSNYKNKRKSRRRKEKKLHKTLKAKDAKKRKKQ